MKLLRVSVGLLCLMALPLGVQAQNNSPANASPIWVNDGWLNVNIDGSNVERWYRFGVVAGRSYCVEGTAEATPTNTGDTGYDGETNVFRANGVTLIGRADDKAAEPGFRETGGFNPGRVCYIAPGSERNYLRASNSGLGSTARSYRWRVVETTMFGPWFFQGSGYEAFILIKNTTSMNVSAVVTLRSTAGAVLDTQTGIVPANGSFNLMVSAAPPGGFGLASASGSVEIAYGPTVAIGSNSNLMSVGAPGSLSANVTSLNFVAGVSFDTTVAPRHDVTR